MRKFSICVCFLVLVVSALAQEKDLLSELENKAGDRQWVTGAFKSTRVINAHSMEILGKGVLDVRILHRFGLISSGGGQFFGLDQASMRIGLDFGLSRNVMIGVGRSTFRKELDVFVKARIIRQSEGSHASPLSVLLAFGGTLRTEKYFFLPKPGFAERSGAYLQLIAGRKFTGKWSLQLSPIVLYSGTPFNSRGDQWLLAPGIGTRYKLNKRVALTLDYHVPLAKMDSIYTKPLSVGFDIETGGHVFQLHFSNSAGMNERAFLTETTGAFFKGDIRFGFNLSRIFQVGKKARLGSP